MPSVLQTLRWSIIGLRCLFHLIRICICIIAILSLIPVNIAGSQVKPVEFSRRPSSLAGGGDGIALVTFATIIFIIPAAPWHHEMPFIIHAIVGYWDVSVSASDLRLLKRHVGGQIVKKNSIVKTRCFNTDDHGRRWVPPLLDPILDFSKSVFTHTLLVSHQ